MGRSGRDFYRHIDAAGLGAASHAHAHAGAQRVPGLPLEDAARHDAALRGSRRLLHRHLTPDF